MSSYNDLKAIPNVAPGLDYISTARYNDLVADLRPQFATLRYRDGTTPSTVALTDVPLLLNIYDEGGFFPPAPDNQFNSDVPSASISCQRTGYSKVAGQLVGMMVRMGLDITAVVSAGGGVKTVFFELYADGSPICIIEEYSVRNGDLILKSDTTLGNIVDGTAISLYAYTAAGDSVDLDFYTLQYALIKVPLGVTDAVIAAAPVIF